jgi:hypothetical protein
MEKSHGCINPRRKAPGTVTQDTVMLKVPYLIKLSAIKKE